LAYCWQDGINLVRSAASTYIEEQDTTTAINTVYYVFLQMLNKQVWTIGAILGLFRRFSIHRVDELQMDGKKFFELP